MIKAGEYFRLGMTASLAASCLMMSAVHAEEVDAVEPELEEKTVELSFMSYPAKPGLQPFHLQTGESSTLEVNAANQYISDAYKVAPMEKWSLGLFRKRGDREEEFVSLATCDSLESDHQLVILGHPIDPDEDQYQMTVVDCSPDYFKYGSFLFLNLTDAKLTAHIDKEEMQIEPGSHAVSSPVLIGDETYVQAQAFTNKDANKKKILNSRWPVQRDIRSLVIFYQGANNRVLMHTIRQSSPDEN